MKSKHVGRDKNDESLFSTLLEQSMKQQEHLSRGEHSVATVTSTKNNEYVFIKTDLGNGVVPREELLNDAGEITVNPGEKLDVFFLALQHGDRVFTTKPSGEAARSVLETLMEQSIPTEGRITRKVKGGYEVAVGDVTAFCPGSQMETEEDSPGSRHMFLVTEVSEKKVIVSQRALKDRERARQKEQLRNSLQEGDVVTGKVLSLHNFGAFVELGGVEGMIPVSEMSFKRINHPNEVLTVGQEVRTRVIQIDWKEDRITLSYRALLENPWQGNLPFAEGEILEGTVEGTRNFGIFVQLPDSFTGLIPMSESGIPRGQTADKHYSRGDRVRVMVKRIDRQNERISLSVKDVQDADTRKEYEDYMKSMGQEESSEEGISSFGKALLKSLEGKEKKKDSGS